MSAVALLAQAGSLRGAQMCPHPERLQSCAIRIDADRTIVMCPECKETLEQLIAGYHARTIKMGEVSLRVQALGYTRRDAARFALQLISDRLKLRAGLLTEDQI